MAVEEKEERVRQGAVAPNGFFVEEGVTVGPRAAVREVVSEFDATSRELQLVATAEVRPGDVILQERVLLEWHANDTELLTQKRANATPSESILAQRCAAIKKLSEQMKSASEHAATVLPLLHAACTASPADFAAILRLPYTLRDTNTPKETLVNKTGMVFFPPQFPLISSSSQCFASWRKRDSPTPFMPPASQTTTHCHEFALSQKG